MTWSSESIQAHLKVLHRDIDEMHAKEGEMLPVVRQKAGSLVEHVTVLALPSMGTTHASISSGQIHLAAVVGQQLKQPKDSVVLVPGGIRPEAYRCCQILEQVLKACGSSVYHLVRITCHVPELNKSKLDAIGEVIDIFCKERGCHSITRSNIGCSRLRDGAAVQIEGVAGAQAFGERPYPFWTPPRLAPKDFDSPSTPSRTAFATPPPVARPKFEDLLFPGDDICAPAAAAAAAATAAVLEDGEPEAWVLVEPTDTTTPSPPLQAVPPPDKLTSLPTDGFYGLLSSLKISSLSAEKAHELHPEFSKDFNTFYRMEMTGMQNYRTVRLEPSMVMCRPAEACHQGRWKPPVGTTWSFSFSVAVESTESSYVNIGLVEWLSTRKEKKKGARTDGAEAPAEDAKLSLADLMEVKSVAEDTAPPGGFLAQQHVSENPKQMMLGCRKGVHWFGNSMKYALFKDDICAGSVLHFRCDYHLNRHGEPVQVKLWLLPSPVVFQRQGKRNIKESDLWNQPLAQWPPWEPRWGGYEQENKQTMTMSLWVPAVTFFSPTDAVTVAWEKPGGPCDNALYSAFPPLVDSAWQDAKEDCS
mmetsp:Transcript_89746/g.159531  ORF Transcript_89746/g.159531 Transcript_89746/m.159531 type:complete len:586 (+) Transcript_89746:88-1845(+)